MLSMFEIYDITWYVEYTYTHKDAIFIIVIFIYVIFLETRWKGRGGLTCCRWSVREGEGLEILISLSLLVIVQDYFTDGNISVSVVLSRR